MGKEKRTRWKDNSIVKYSCKEDGKTLIV